jgi:hypothetical protein
VLTVVGVTSLSSGLIQNLFGWVTINISVLPVILLVVVALIGLKHYEKRFVNHP